MCEPDRTWAAASPHQFERLGAAFRAGPFSRQNTLISKLETSLPKGPSSHSSSFYPLKGPLEFVQIIGYTSPLGGLLPSIPFLRIQATSPFGEARAPASTALSMCFRSLFTAALRSFYVGKGGESIALGSNYCSDFPGKNGRFLQGVPLWGKLGP